MSLKMTGGFKPIAAGQFKLGDSAPPATLGRQYANNYVAVTGGTIYEAPAGGDITATVDSMSNGDAIIMEEGTHTIDALYNNQYVSYPNRLKSVLFVGDTNDAGNVLFDVDHWGESIPRDDNIIASGNNRHQYAFLSYKRTRPGNDGSPNYSVSLVRDGRYAYFTNVYLDFNNGDFSWIYNNNNSAGNVTFNRCTFANFNNIQPRYSGLTDNVRINDCLLESASNYRFNDVLETNPVTNATIDTVNRTYNTTTYPSNGHLYVPVEVTTPIFTS